MQKLQKAHRRLEKLKFKKDCLCSTLNHTHDVSAVALS